MTCEHCEKDDMTIIDTTGAAQPILNINTPITGDAACVAPTFCSCECHNINADRGA